MQDIDFAQILTSFAQKNFLGDAAASPAATALCAVTVLYMHRLPVEFRLKNFVIVSGRISGIRFLVFTEYSVSSYPANLLSGTSLILS